MFDFLNIFQYKREVFFFICLISRYVYTWAERKYLYYSTIFEKELRGVLQLHVLTGASKLSVQRQLEYYEFLKIPRTWILLRYRRRNSRD